MNKGKLIVISAPSGCGKSTVVHALMERRPKLRFSISATTRAPRPSEVHGMHYYFVTKEQFEEMIASGQMLEYSAHAANYYGTPRAQAEEKLREGHLLLDIEPNGAFNVRKTRPDAVLIFIAPPSLEELERRLRSRGTDSEEAIQKRLKRAKEEIDIARDYDYHIVNDELDACAEELYRILQERQAD